MKKLTKILSLIIIMILLLSTSDVLAATPRVCLSKVKVVLIDSETQAKITFTSNTLINVTAKIYDAKKRIKRVLVNNKSYKKGTRYINWNLLDSKGKRVAAGRYKLVINAKNTKNRVLKSVFFNVKADNKVSLIDVTLENDFGIVNWAKPKDREGNLYKSGLIVSLNGVGEIILNKKYKEFVSKIVVPYDDRNLRNGARLQFYLDDVLAYESHWMQKGSYLVDVKLDVTNVDKIRIVYGINLVGFSDMPPRLGIVSGYFLKK